MTRTLRPLMVLGCSSNAGKSLLVTALARWFRRQGVDVAPFKAQNMSNNARVVDGGEIGVAQWLQARAAAVPAHVSMNPVLCKPEAETRSQVVVLGRPRHDLTVTPWPERGPHLWPAMSESFDHLRARHELVLLEGAGSPAEINLPDLVNNRILEHADAAAILVVDIDRGGAFAHLHGTWSLVPDATRNRLRAFVLNKFRGDADLLAPGPALIAARTGMSDLGVLPMLRHDLPDEEGATVRGHPPREAPEVAVLRFPFGSNLDELHLLAHAARVRFVTEPADLDGASLVVLPGSKHVAADLRWMRHQALDIALTAAIARGVRVLAICGGAMMLGHAVVDAHGVEGRATGLGLLPFDTVMQPDKVARSTSVVLDGLPGPWDALEGRRVDGFEIRNGTLRALGAASDVSRDERVWASGPVLATTVHGLLEDPAVLEGLTGVRPAPVLERTFELLADAIDASLNTDALWSLVRG